MKEYVTLLSLLSFSLSTPLFSQPFPGRDQEFEKLAQSTMTFLNIDVGARAVGMGGAFICMENDVSALFWNPAGIAKIKGGVISINHTQWIADMKQYAVGAAYGSNNLGTFGLTFLLMDNGSIERTVPDPTQSRGFRLEGTFQVNQWAAGLAYARQLTNKFTIGGQVKFAYQDLGDALIAVTPEDTVGREVQNNKGAIAVDFGTLYYFGYKDLRIGMSFRNFGPTVKYDFESFNLPVTFKIGMAMNMLGLVTNVADQELQFNIETVLPYDQSERIQMGWEYMFKDLLALRLGYRTSTDIGAFSAGFGLTPAAFGGVSLMLDYAYSGADEALGAIHRFSFGFTF